MKIRFGWLLDGSAWAARPYARTEHPRDVNAVPALGTDASHSNSRADIVAGPRTLVSILATRLGLTHPPVKHSVRVAQYRALIGHKPTPWCAASFELDPWNTAVQLLGLRDEAVASGWVFPSEAPDATQFPRLHTLWSIEQSVTIGMPGNAEATLAPGYADDLVGIRNALEERAHDPEPWPLGISSIECMENPAELPGQWPRMYELLQKQGIEITDAAPGADAPAFTLVRAPQELTAAEVAAHLIAEQTPAPDSGSTDADPVALTVLATENSIALDAQLARRDLPPVAHVPATSHRLAMQIVPLFLDALGPHLDVQALASLLTLELPCGGERSTHLLPTYASRKLVDALTREAGISTHPDSAWQQALHAIKEHDAHIAETAQNPEHVPVPHTPVVQEFCALLAPKPHEYYAPSMLGAPENTRIRVAALNARLDFLDARLSMIARSARTIVPVIRAHVSTLRTLLDLACDSAAGAAVSERELTDLITAAAPSQRSMLGHRTPTPWTLVTEAAHIDATRTPEGDPGGSRHTVIWWGAIDSATSRPTTWDDTEMRLLTGQGARVLTRDALATLETRIRLAAFSRATRVIAIAPERIDGETTRLNPLISHLAVQAWNTHRGTPATLSDILSDPEFATDAHAFFRDARERGDVDPVDEKMILAPTHLARRVEPGLHLMPSSLSYSQLHTLITDTTSWILRYPFGIKPGGAASVPTGDRMIGNLLHAVVEELVHQHRLDDGHVSTQRILDTIAAGGIERLLEELVPRHASELALPGHEALRHDVTETARHSIEHLCTTLRDAGISIRAIEHPISNTTLPLTITTPDGPQNIDVPFGGSIDFLGEDADGNPVILDFKWTRGEKHYRERVRNGTALQLATYAWALNNADAGHAERSGYFLLRQGEFVTADAALGGRAAARLNPPASATIFARANRSAEHALSMIANGTVRSETGQNAVMDRHPQVRMTPRDLSALRRRSHERRGRYFEDVNASYSDYTLLTGVEGDFS